MALGIRYLDLGSSIFGSWLKKKRGVSSHEEAMCPLRVKRCPLVPIFGTWQALTEARVLHISGFRFKEIIIVKNNKVGAPPHMRRP